MKIIDWETKGNVVRFYLGKDELKEWCGDDWNDRPYEHNSGMVYKGFISDIEDVKLDFDDEVIEPCYGHSNSPYSKDDFRDRKVPCLIIVKKKDCPEDSYKYHSFCDWVLYEKSIKIYFGDNIEKIINSLEVVKGVNKMNYKIGDIVIRKNGEKKPYHARYIFLGTTENENIKPVVIAKEIMGGKVEIGMFIRKPVEVSYDTDCDDYNVNVLFYCTDLLEKDE